MDEILSLFSNTAFVAIFSSTLTSICTTLGTLFIQKMTLNRQFEIEKYKTDREHRRIALSKLIVFLNELSDTYDPENDYRIKDFSHLMKEYYISKLEVDLLFTPKKMFEKLEILNEIYQGCLFAYLDDSYGKIERRLRTEVPNIISEIKEMARKEIRKL